MQLSMIYVSGWKTLFSAMKKCSVQVACGDDDDSDGKREGKT